MNEAIIETLKTTGFYFLISCAACALVFWVLVHVGKRGEAEDINWEDFNNDR